MEARDELRERIIDTAIAQGERRSSWEAVRLHDVARELGIPLDEVRRCFQDKDAVVEAWFDRADAAMLALSASPGFTLLTPRQRLVRLMMTWFDALAPHRRIARRMICAKLAPGHLHLQIPGAARVNRTVQWIREAAHRDATWLRRALEESYLTTVYLTAFLCWMYDGSLNSGRTRDYLDRALAAAETLDRWLHAGRPHAATPADAPPSPTGHAGEEPTL